MGERESLAISIDQRMTAVPGESEIQELSMGEVESLASSMIEKMRAVPREPEKMRAVPREPDIICRVPKRIREVDRKAFNPKMISIGPFHHGKDALRPMQELKWRFLRDLIGRNPENSVKILKKYITGVKSVEPWKYYSEPVPANNSFMEMMVLDGCFIIEFILKVVQGRIDDQPFSVTSNVPLIMLDLLLLENQIPFRVLECLFSETRGVPEGTLKDTAVGFLFRSYYPLGKYEPIPAPEVVHHLLHLFYSFLVPDYWRSTLTGDTSSNVPWWVKKLLMNKPKHILSNCFFSMRSLFVTIRPPRRWAANKILGASSLREAGVKFEINKDARSLLDITFRNGTLKIPYTLIDENTVSRFRNLLAFDQCNLSYGHFSSYVALMSGLIQKPEDLKLLEDRAVVECRLSGHEEVVRFFATLDKGSNMPFYRLHYFEVLIMELNEYCVKRRHLWKEKLKHDYFSNPWTLISVIAAFVLLVLTVVQTLYTVIAYYRPS